MFTKIYIALLAVSVLAISTAAFLTYSQLQSIGFSAEQNVQNFLVYDGWLKNILWISSIILLVLANVVLWTQKKAWALWTAFGYFAVFLLLDMWWLNNSLVAYQKQKGIFNGSFQFGGIFAAFMVVIVGVGIFFNQFIVLRLHNKMFAEPKEIAETTESLEGVNSDSEE